MADGFKHIAERPVDPIGQPGVTNATYVNTNNTYDVAIAGIPFFLAVNKDHPYTRETAPYRKTQIDQQKEVGEQTLTGWWLRSQSSFHYGAGIRYEEPIQGETVSTRFNRSAGVEVFNIGKVTLLPDVSKVHDVTNTPKMVGATDTAGVDVVIWADGSTLYRTTAAGATTTLTWGGSGTILAVAQDGKNYYVANATGIYRGPLTGATSGTSIFTHPTVATGTVTNVAMAWVKQRMIAGINNFLYEITPIQSFTISAAQISNNTVTLKTNGTAHNFVAGSQITVASVGTAFNGTWVVTAVPSATEVQYYRNNADIAWTTGLTGTAVLATNNDTPTYVHPNSNWIWTGVCEGPNAIYASGYAGDSSSLYRLGLDTQGALPTLTKAFTAADMPKGELIYAIGSYIGKYMVFGTNKGVRIGQIDTSGYYSSGYVTYGPLTVVTNGFSPTYGTEVNGLPVKSIAFNDRYAYCTVTNWIDSDGAGTMKSGLVKIDLSREIVANQMAYATHLQVPTTAEASSVVVIGSTNKLAIGVQGNGLYFQSNDLVPMGYLQTGQIRYFTLEDKHFELAKLRQTLPMLGQLNLTLVNPDETTYDIITVDQSFDFTQDIAGVDYAADELPKESIAMRFTFYAAEGQQVGQEDSFNGYQLKALPAVRRQRIITLPLENFDFEGDRYNMMTGYEGRGAERLLQLETIEGDGDVVTLQDFTNNETVRGVIEAIKFIRETPPERRYKNFAGIIIVQFRTV